LRCAYPETNPESSTAPDAFTSVEKTTAAEHNLTNVIKPRISSLAELSSRRNTDPYALSSGLRRTFREAKKVDKKIRAEEKGVRDKFALPEDLVLVREDDVRDEAREEWERGRRDWEREEDVRRKRIESQYGTLSLNDLAPSTSAKGKPRVTSTSSVSSKRAAITKALSQHSSAASTILASTVLRNSLKRKDPFLSSASLGGKSSSVSRPKAKDVGIMSRRS